MPLVSYNTKADFDAAYDLNAEPEGHPGTRQGIRLHYNRAVMLPYAQRLASKMHELLVSRGYTTATNILIVGAGYAWTAETLESVYGYTNIVTTDTSPYIQTTQNTTEEADVDAAIAAVGLNPTQGEGASKKTQLYGNSPGNRRRHSRAVENEDLSNNGSRNRIRNILGNIAVGITEEVISTLSDAEALQISDWVDKINAGIARIHYTTELLPDTPQNPAYNWKTIEQWKVLLPGDTFVSLHDWEVV